jgi:hypothetical protein
MPGDRARSQCEYDAHDEAEELIHRSTIAGLLGMHMFRSAEGLSMRVCKYTQPHTMAYQRCRRIGAQLCSERWPNGKPQACCLAPDAQHPRPQIACYHVQRLLRHARRLICCCKVRRAAGTLLRGRVLFNEAGHGCSATTACENVSGASAPSLLCSSGYVNVAATPVTAPSPRNSDSTASDMPNDLRYAVISNPTKTSRLL